MQAVVIDTNVVLDAFVFADPRALPLGEALEAGAVAWLATAPMRDELERVLAYPKIVRQMALRALAATQVLERFDRHAVLHAVPPRAPVHCKDEDDQKFVDLAVAHGALLVSKDREVLKLDKRARKLGCVAVTAAYDASVKEFSLAAGQ